MSVLTFKPGRYRGRMARATLGKSNTKGTPQIAFEFTPIGMYGANGLEACAADERTIFKYVSDNTIDYLIQDLAALGFDRASFAEIDSDAPNAFPWRGIEFDCRLTMEDYDPGDGKPVRQKERWEFARGKATGKPIEQTEVAGLDAKYGAYLKGRGAAATATAGATAQPVTRVDDDVPF